MDTRPATELEPVKSNGTVLRGEGVAADSAALELLVNTGASAGEARAGPAGLGLRSLGLGGGRLGGGRGRVDRLGDIGRGLSGSLGGSLSLGLVELSTDLLLLLGSLGGLSSRGLRSGGGIVGRVRLANNNEASSVKTGLGSVDVDLLSGKLVDGFGGTNDNLGDNVRAALLDLGASMAAVVHVLVLVVLGGGAGGERGRKSVSDKVLHCNGMYRGPTIKSKVMVSFLRSTVAIVSLIYDPVPITRWAKWLGCGRVQ